MLWGARTEPDDDEHWPQSEAIGTVGRNTR